MTVAISCAGLVKTFGPTTALDGLDLEVATGEVHGFLGPNGAGKTVTMRILLGLLRRDRGEATVLGSDPWEDAVALHRRMAYVPGDTNLWPNLTGGEIIDVLAGLHGGIDPGRRAHLVERFDLDLRKKARSYSKGNRQKVALVAALASDAELLILDEPTAGLDPLMEAIFQEHILEAKAEQRTILLSSHILAEVEKLCDRVTIIRRGRTVQSGTLEELRHLTRTTIAAQTHRSARWRTASSRWSRSTSKVTRPSSVRRSWMPGTWASPPADRWVWAAIVVRVRCRSSSSVGGWRCGSSASPSPRSSRPPACSTSTPTRRPSTATYGSSATTRPWSPSPVPGTG